MSLGASPSRADCVVAMICSAPSCDWSANSVWRERREREENEDKRESKYHSNNNSIKGSVLTKISGGGLVMAGST